MKTRFISVVLATLMILSSLCFTASAADEGAVIAMERTNLQSGTANITFSFDSCTVDGSADWIGIYRRSVWNAGGKNSYIDWLNCPLTTSGAVTFPSNDSTRMKDPSAWAIEGTIADGEYTAVLYSNGGYTVLDTIEFSVYSAVIAETTLFYYGDEIVLTPRYSEGDTKTSADWIGIYSASQTDYSTGYVDYAYIREDKDGDGSLTFPSYASTRLQKPLPIGNYQAVFLANDSYTLIDETPFYFTVVPKIETVSKTIYIGDSFEVYCGTGVDENADWIGVYPKNKGYSDWVWHKDVEATYTFPSSNKNSDYINVPGTYEISYLNSKSQHQPPSLFVEVVDTPAVLDGETLTVYKNSGFDLSTIEAPAKEGYVFKGWADENGNIPESTTVTCPAGTVYTATYEEETTEEEIIVTSDASVLGAQIRLSGDSADLRFVSSIDKELLATLGITEFSGENVKFGSIVLPADLLGDEELTKETAQAAVVPAVKRYAENSKEVYFTVCLVNISENNYDRIFTVRPYIEYTDENGTVQTMYGESYGTLDGGASLYSIALEVQKDYGTKTPASVMNVINTVEAK